MSVSPCQVRLCGQTLHLLPQRCLWWEEHRALILSDLHLGKSAALRAAGMPVPEGDTADDLARLDSVLAALDPRELIIVGDLFHAPAARSQTVLALFSEWRGRHASLAIHLIVGNHDLGALPPEACAIAVAEPRLVRAPIHFVHDPAEAGAKDFSICGHLHPVLALPGGGPGKLRAACFWLSGTRLILPSFGGFTGGAVIAPRAEDRVFAITADAVREIPSALWAPPPLVNSHKGTRSH